ATGGVEDRRERLAALASTTVLLILIVFAIVNVSVLVLRRSPVNHSHFTSPSFIPVLGAITCVILVTQQEAGTWLRAAVVILIGFALYGLNIYLKRRAGETPGSPSGQRRVR
ncbi:MAG: hypothetical protein ACR2KW_06590, partial [Rubrobacter sp.]